MISEFIPATGDRVPQHTDPHVNDQIRIDTLSKIEYYRQHKDQIHKRLEELEREWDTERFLEANASTLVVLGTILGFAYNKKWFIVPGIVGSFLLQHAVQGWCPPLPLIRRLGFRTADEINQERLALQCLQEDVNKICDSLEGIASRRPFQ